MVWYYPGIHVPMLISRKCEVKWGDLVRFLLFSMGMVLVGSILVHAQRQICRVTVEIASIAPPEISTIKIT